MEVTIDGINRNFEGGTTVLELVGTMTEQLRAEGRALVSLAVDGESISPETLASRFDTLAAEGHVITAETRPVAELLAESLEALSSTLPELPVACRKLAQIFQSEVPSEGFEPFEELAGIWDHIKAQQRMIAGALGIDLVSVEIDGQPISVHLSELNSFLDESAQALRDGDMILLGDLLEYELAPRAELEIAIVAELRRQAEAAAR